MLAFAMMNFARRSSDGCRGRIRAMGSTMVVAGHGAESFSESLWVEEAHVCRVVFGDSEPINLISSYLRALITKAARP